MVQAHTPGAIPRLAGAEIERCSDADLVAQFVENSNPEAFAELVRRHGPMVLGVCRRALSDSHIADDAFQATFLVLARKAAGIATGAGVGSWLFGVAVRAAARAKTQLARHRTREIGGADMTMVPARPEPNSVDAELLTRLDQELAALPEKYRAAVVLCELEGRSLKEAAATLGVPQGTVASRLARGRELLATRLRRSVPVASVAVVLGLLTRSASAVPPRLHDLVVGSACDPNLVSTSVLSLTQGVIRSMFLTKLWTVAAISGVLALLVGTATIAVNAAENLAPSTARTTDAGQEVAGKEAPDEPVTSKELLQVGVAYHDYLTSNSGKAPQSLKDLEPGLKDARAALAHLKTARIEVYYGVTVEDMVYGATKTILGHERDAPTKGGFVLFGDASVRKLTAEEFSKFPIATPKK